MSNEVTAYQGLAFSFAETLEEISSMNKLASKSSSRSLDIPCYLTFDGRS
jgi:hypothetical protein